MQNATALSVFLSVLWPKNQVPKADNVFYNAILAIAIVVHEIKWDFRSPETKPDRIGIFLQ